ncbi:hypothetical protein AOQ84DRAFT_433438 [Glonium stellatum]|uniref:Zn(2)-C6 fungal-type domain-containing protein n=1 Tax=Glonium stellatum TaxID=574774 RepID=A0A8E2ETD1_9PEZI|nr:hypothetical protein AOQ84DRAFT_433438 [Glonium stellatum]
MAELASTHQTAAVPGSTMGRKKMRKGTQSCTECRRRKVRCIFPPGESTVCSPCSTRGSRCVDQRDDIAARAEDERMTLRERVARLESMLESVLPMIPGESLQSVSTIGSTPVVSEAGDIEIPAGENDRQMLLMRSHGAEEAPKTRGFRTPSSPAHGLQSPASFNYSATTCTTTSQQSQSSERKNKEVCGILRSALPRYDTMMSTLSNNGFWWSAFRYKTCEVIEPLPVFAARSYTSNDPIELGILVAAYARCSNENYNLYVLVENLIISDSVYSATVEGLECLILLSKVYSDIGQPRRSWFLYRRGLGIAQLMGIDRRNSKCPKGERVWLSLYHGDRFMSMLLGLPYGINDAHYGLIMDSDVEGSGFLQQQFTLRCSLVTGKLIDRNLAAGKPSYGITVDLDERLDAIANAMPKRWWDIPTILPDSGPELDQVRERLLQQFFFFHIKTYLHLPFLLKPSMTSPYDHNKSSCIDSCRQMLRLFKVFRTEVGGEFTYECKTSDFISFMAAVIFIVGLSSSDCVPNLRASEDDIQLLESTKKIFEREEKERGCKVASQCRKTLELLSGMQDESSSTTDSLAEPDKIVIPYFGTLNFLANTQAVEYDGSNLPNSMLGSMQWEVDDFGNLIGDDLAPWLNTTMMDIDQDWSMFLDMNNPSSNI